MHCFRELLYNILQAVNLERSSQDQEKIRAESQVMRYKRGDCLRSRIFLAVEDYIGPNLGGVSENRKASFGSTYVFLQHYLAYLYPFGLDSREYSSDKQVLDPAAASLPEVLPTVLDSGKWCI